MYYLLAYDKRNQEYPAGKGLSLQKVVLEKLDSLMQKIETVSPFILYMKIN